MANPVLITGTQNSAAIASGTSATVTSTGSVTAGNLMAVVMLVGGASQPTLFTAPDGTWTTSLATIATASGGTIAAAIFTKQATATGSFSGSFGWTTTATSGHWLFMEWAGTGAGLLDGTISAVQNASGTKTSPTKTPTVGVGNDTLVCLTLGGVVGTDTLTVPVGMTSILTVAGTAGVPFFGCASLGLASAGATGTKTWTIPTSRTNLGVSFLIQSGDGLSAINDLFVMTYSVPPAPVATRYNLYFGHDTSGSASQPADTPPHFIARPWPIQFQILPLLRGNVPTNAPVAATVETNSHFLGRFVQPKFNLPSYAGAATDVPAAGAASQASDNAFVVAYEVPPAPVAARYLYYFSRATDVPVAAVDTPPHFLGKFSAPAYNILPLLRSNAASNASSATVQPETQPHFIGRFRAPAFSRFAFNGPPEDQGSAVAFETNTHFVGRFSQPRHAVLPLLRSNVAADASSQTAQIEAQPHFLGRFTQAAFARFRYSHSAQDVSGPQPETNTHFVGTFRAPQHVVLRSLRLSSIDPSASGPLGAQPDSPPHFLGRHTAPKFKLPSYSGPATDVPAAATSQAVNNAFVITYNVPRAPIAASYLYYFGQAPIAAATVETNSHFLGRFQPPAHRILPALRSNAPGDISAPTVETNTHFIAKFTAPAHVVLQALRSNVAADASSATVQPETQPHFLGRFTAPKHHLPPYHGLATDVATASVNAAINNAFVITYAVPRAPIASSYLYYFNKANDAPAVVVQATVNPHFVPRFWDPEITVLMDLWMGQAGDAPAVDVPTNFVPRFSQPQFNRLPLVSFANDLPAVQQPSTSAHTVPRSWPVAFRVIAALRQNVPADAPAAVVTDDPANFLGRFSAPVFHRLPNLSSPTDLSGPLPVQPEAQPHFVAKPWPVAFRLLTALRHNVPLDPIFPAQPETNVNFLGRFAPTRHAVLQLLRQNVAADTSTAQPQPSTPAHTIGRFTQPRHFVNRALFENVPTDAPPVAQPETNTHFLGRFTQPGHFVLPALRLVPAHDAQPETNTHYVPKTWPVAFNRRPIVGADTSRGSAVAQPETNVHTVGRFAPPAHALLLGLRQNVPTDPFVAPPDAGANPHFLGRFSPPTFARFWYNEEIESRAFFQQALTAQTTVTAAGAATTTSAAGAATTTTAAMAATTIVGDPRA